MGLLDRLADRVSARVEERGVYARTTPNDPENNLLVNDPDGWVTDGPGIWHITRTGKEEAWWLGSDQTGQAIYGNARNVLPALSRAVALVSEPIGAMPMRVVDIEDSHTLPLPRWLEDPMLSRPDGRFTDNEVRRPTDLTRAEFYAQLVATMLLRGNAYVLFVRGVDGYPLAGTMRPINPANVTIDDTTGRMEYVINNQRTVNGVLNLGGIAVEVMDFRGIPPYDEWGRAYGVLDRHAAALGLAEEVRRFAGGQLSNGIPPGFLKVSNPNLTDKQAGELKQKWMETYGSSQKSIAVLNATTDFQTVNLTPVDAEMISLMKMSLLDVALACGVEPSMLGVSADSNTYANVESRQIQFQMFTLLPYVSRMEDTLSSYLPQGQRVDIIMRALMRADTQTRIDGYAQALRDGWMNVNEVRVLEGFEPIEGGEEFRKHSTPASGQGTQQQATSLEDMSDNKGGVATLNAPRNSNPEKVA